MFEFNYIVTENDYFEFNRYHAMHSPVGIKSRRISMLMLPAILFILLVIDIINGRTESMGIKVFIYAAFSGLWALLIGPLMRINIKFSTNLLKKNGKLPYDSQISLRFDDEFIYEKSTLTEIKMSYAKLERIAVGEAGIYLYHTVISAFLIPNRVLASAIQKHDFLEFIHQKTNLPIEGIL